MKRKGIVFLIMLALLCQSGFAFTAYPENMPLGDKQEIFYRMGVEESMRIKNIEGMAYYPAEDAVYLQEDGRRLRAYNNAIVVSEEGFVAPEEAAFYQEGFVYDFEVDQAKGFLLVEGQGPYLIDETGNGVPIMDMAPHRQEFEVYGSQFAWIGLPINPEFSPIIDWEYQFATLPETFDDGMVMFDRTLPIGFVYPVVFDFSADGSEIVAFGTRNEGNFRTLALQETADLYLEILAIPTEPNVLPGLGVVPNDPLIGVPLVPSLIEPGVLGSSYFQVKVDGYGEESQNLEIRDMYTTEDHIVVLFHELNQERSFIQRYAYDGELVDQLETNYRTRKITAGPNGSTLYLQKRFIEEGDAEYGEYGLGSWQLEVIQTNWDQEEAKASTGRMKPVISERNFGGKTIARFADDGFGLLKQVKEDTGILDYKAPLKSQAMDVRLQIPYEDALAKAGLGARNLVLTYLGQEIAIPFERLMSVDLASMPCTDEATIEIHLQADEAGQVTISIDLFVVEQVDAMTRLVHRTSIQ